MYWTLVLALGLVACSHAPTRVVIDDVELHFVEQGRGEPVVLIHGSLADYSYWQASDQIEPLAGHYRVIAYSRRYNHPNDNQPRPDHSAVVEAEDLAKLLTVRESGPVHLVGHSYGAYTALLFALDHPDQVRSLVLAEPPILPWLPDIPAGVGITEGFMAGVWEPMATTFREQGDAAGLEHAAQLFFGVPFAQMQPLWQTLFGRNVREWRALTLSQASFPQVDHDRVRGLRVPVLILSGGKNAGGFNDLIDGELERLLPNAQRVVIAEASHEMFLDFPEVTARTMREFFQRHPAPAP